MALKNGLSRMRGDPPVRFSGGGGAVMLLLPDNLNQFLSLKLARRMRKDRSGVDVPGDGER
ncbi:hypothetical protein AA01_24225 [Salmonella enterica subsp. enterica serovar Pomona]|nr:hypothetical protein [Salmonella enterica subsp. enterica serovar Pomona]